MPVFISHRSSDTNNALKINEMLRYQGIDTYLDVLDEASKSTDDITRIITERMRHCTHLIAVLSNDTAGSWWVPFEIGEATIIDRRIASFTFGRLNLPEYLDKWPKMTSFEHLSLFIKAYKQDSMTLSESIGAESYSRRSTSKAGAEQFHESLKRSLRFY